MTTISTLIVDDEPLARRRVAALLAPHPDFRIVEECGDGASAIEAIERERPDLVFLDVQMPKLNGFDVLTAALPLHRPLFVFTTAHDHYAVQAFDRAALDYLLKPFKRARFEETLTRVRARLTTGAVDETEGAANPGQDRLVVRSQGQRVILRSDEIEWIEAAANYVQIHCGSRVYPVREKIGDYEQLLPPTRFARIHRSCIVNLDAVARVESCGGGEYLVVLHGGKELSIGRSYVERVTRQLTGSALPGE